MRSGPREKEPENAEVLGAGSGTGLSQPQGRCCGRDELLAAHSKRGCAVLISGSVPRDHRAHGTVAVHRLPLPQVDALGSHRLRHQLHFPLP